MPNVSGVPAVKVRPPRRSAQALPRARLLDALHEHADHKLQIVIAPAGFGKTTLLVDFAHDAAFPVCWAALDASDQDLAAFVETIVAAVQRSFPRFGPRTLAALHGAPDAERRLSAIVRTFTAEIEETVDSLALLLLDDYHEVNDSAPVTRLMDELLRTLPDNLRIVLAGRALPRLAVSRLIVEGQLFGLGEADLRFTAEELLTLLRRRQGGRVPPEQAQALAQGAEGWIAGFLLSVPRLWDGMVGGIIASQGAQGPLYDYLAAEAFDRQPPEVQRFLLATSVPETANIDLCTALLGPGEWRVMLDTVDGAGLFVTRLRGGRGAFRYHQMFRGFLQTRLRRTDPAAYARLHRLTGERLAAAGQWIAAIGHYREAGQEDAAIALAVAAAPELERAERWRMLAEMVTALPREAVAAHPALLVPGTRAALMTQDMPRAETLAEDLRVAAARAGDPRWEAWGYAFLGNVRRSQGRTREALEALARSLALAPGDEELAATVRRDRGLCLGVQGDFDAAAAELREALAYFDRRGAMYDAARTEFGLGVALAKAGQIAEAITRYESALGRWRGLGDTSMEAEILNCIGYAHARRGDYARARETLEAALEKLRGGGPARIEAATLHSLGEVLLVAGQTAAARDAFERGLAVAQDSGDLWTVSEVYAALALTAALEGQHTRAAEQAHHALALAERQDSPYLAAQYTLVLGAAELRAGRPAALATLQQGAALTAGLEAPRERAQAELWLAQARFAAGDHMAAGAHLRRALRFADDLGADAVLDLHARWNPALFVDAAARGIAPARFQASLERAHVVLAPARAAVPVELPALAARAFGTGELWIEGVRLAEWPWEKSRELFFFLLHSGPRRPEQIIAALWPDTPHSRAKYSLHSAVHRLRRAVHKQAILFQGGVYRLNDEMVTSYDAREFERLARAGVGATGDEAAVLLQQAADLSTAPYLDDLDAAWAADERQRLDGQLRVVLGRLADAYAAAGRPRESIAAAERLLALDPLREDAYARIIRAYLRLGDRAVAAQWLDHCAAVLRDELGIGPGEELQSLARRIRV